MLYVEVLAPAGTLDDDDRAELGRRLSARTLLAADGATDPGVLDLFASLSHVVVREPESWFADGARVGADLPRYLVTVRAGAWAKEMAGLLVRTVSAEMAAFAAEHGRPEPRVQVQVLGVTDDGFGVDGVVYGFTELAGLVERARVRDPDAAPPGTYIDPTCGAAVPTADAVIAEVAGRTYGFCCTGCRGRFVKRARAGT